MTLPGRILLSVLLLSVACPALARPEGTELEQVEQDLSARQERYRELTGESRKLAAETKDISRQLVKAAESLRAAEQELLGVQDGIRQTEAEEKDQTLRLLSDRRYLSDLLASLQRLSRVPPESILVREGEPAELVRSTILLRAAVPRLKDRATTLAQNLDALASLREGLARQREASEQARRTLATKHAELAGLLKDRKTRQKASEAELAATRTMIRDLQQKASSLRDLAERVEARDMASLTPP
ncbi:MAG: hypothetical protein M3O22_07795, partial [Pseudomonadota bacterium]|nr:hypothetical protein [Pseudomonadota bacterium]